MKKRNNIHQIWVLTMVMSLLLSFTYPFGVGKALATNTESSQETGTESSSSLSSTKKAIEEVYTQTEYPNLWRKLGNNYDAVKVAMAFMDYWVGKGFSGAAAAGIAANVTEESSWDPNTIEYHNGRRMSFEEAMKCDDIGCGIGLIGWTNFTEKKAMRELMKKMNKPWNDLEFQLALVHATILPGDPKDDAQGWWSFNMYEGMPQYAGLRNYYMSRGYKPYKDLGDFKKTDDPVRAAMVFCGGYERPAVNRYAHIWPNREGYAPEWLKLWQKVGGTFELKKYSEKIQGLIDEYDLVGVLKINGVYDKQKAILLEGRDSFTIEERLNLGDVEILFERSKGTWWSVLISFSGIVLILYSLVVLGVWVLRRYIGFDTSDKAVLSRFAIAPKGRPVRAILIVGLLFFCGLFIATGLALKIILAILFKFGVL